MVPTLIDETKNEVIAGGEIERTRLEIRGLEHLLSCRKGIRGHASLRPQQGQQSARSQ
jgi:hypothetical protein